MRRIHAIEIHDQPWCPAWIRDRLTQLLQFAIHVGNNYGPAAPRLRAVLDRTGSRRIVDLCSGGGGPWFRLAADLDKAGSPVEICLTDKFPNLAAFERARSQSGGRIGFHAAPVDATATPAGLSGVRTMFTSFHHFTSPAAQAILRDAVENKQPIAIFESTRRDALSLVLMVLVAPLGALVLPFLPQPLWRRIGSIVLLPVLAAVYVFDGVVSCLRTYSLAELRELTEPLGNSFVWEIGEDFTGRLPVPVTYLIGYPRPEPPVPG